MSSDRIDCGGHHFCCASAFFDTHVFRFRKYSLSSSSLAPTWIPFTSTQAAVETLDFDLRIMTSGFSSDRTSLFSLPIHSFPVFNLFVFCAGDWMYERGSKVFYLNEPINIEASVRVGHHMGFRVFVNSCVATLDPDRDTMPRYVFIDNDGWATNVYTSRLQPDKSLSNATTLLRCLSEISSRCLVDSQLQGSSSHFLPRIQDDKLQFTIDAFKFHKETRREVGPFYYFIVLMDY